MNMKKLTSLILTLLLVLAMAAPAFAAGPGSITIQDSTASVTGRTFKAYKILEATVALDGTPAYSVPDNMKSFYATQFTLDFTGMNQAEINVAVINAIYALRTDAAAMEKFAEAALAAAKIAVPTIAPETVVGGATTAVPYGYYVIEDVTLPANLGGSRTSAVMIDTTNPAAVITLKADKPSIDKQIVASPTNVDATNGAIGDKVNYIITGTVPDMTGFEDRYIYVFKDVMSKGLTFNDDVVVKVTKWKDTANHALGTEVKTLTAGVGTPSETGEYHVTKATDSATGITTVQVVFHDFIDYKLHQGLPIEITYSATINKDAVVGKLGNPNLAEIIYSNDPTNEGKGKPGTPDGGDRTGESPKERTLTFTTAIELTKVDALTKVPLAGAKFKLEGTVLNLVLVSKEVFTVDAAGTYYKLVAGTYTTQAPTGGPTDALYESTTVKYSRTTVNEEKSSSGGTIAVDGVTDKDGKLLFTGLKKGTYKLTELIAPSGYNLLTAPIDIEIGVTLPTTVDTGAEPATWSVVSGPAAVSTDGIITLTVDNNKGVELPGTGGIGTTLFTIGGIVLMGAAVLLLVLRRKKQTKA